MKLTAFVFTVVAGMAVSQTVRAAEQTVPLTSLDLSLIQQDYGEPAVDQSVAGNSIHIGGQKFEHGLGSHAESRFQIAVNGAKRFTATVGLDDDVLKQKGAAEFLVIGDTQVLFDSGMMHTGDAGKPIDLALDSIKQLLLVTKAGPRGIDYCHADWANAEFVVDGASPVAVELPHETAEILTPLPAHTPRINGASIFGVRPGSPILFRIAATGDRPMTFAAGDLPSGVTLDSATGQLGGQAATPGTYAIHFSATNVLGVAKKDFKLVVGDKIALTPPMGWNSWYGYAMRVSDENMRIAADRLVSSGLVDHGYSYVCIDDYWQQAPEYMKKDPTLGGIGRDADGRIVPNPRFPDMKALTDYIHGKGLKAGVYSSPGPFTCGGALGSFGHEVQDAQTYADWGFDLLKYDWCSYKPSMEHKRNPPLEPTTMPTWGAAAQKGHETQVLPYALMGDLLRKQHHDIYYLLCQYGMGDVWTWGDTVGGNSGRTTGDITDTWSAVSAIGFGQYGKQGVAGPGYWTDPDMLMVGVIGLENPHPTHLTPNEQYSQVTLWSILPAPILFGAHLDKLDPFTINLLTNDEVIGVDQDELGEKADRVAKENDTEIWRKHLADGSLAVAMFNRGEAEGPVTAKWSELGITGTMNLHDLWRQKDLAPATDSFTRDGTASWRPVPADVSPVVKTVRGFRSRQSKAKGHGKLELKSPPAVTFSSALLRLNRGGLPKNC